MEYTGANSIVLVNQALNADQADPANNTPHIIVWNLQRNSIQYVNTLTGIIEKEILVGNNSEILVLLFANPTTTWNFTEGTTAELTLTNDTALAITNPVAGTYGTLKVIQDGVGGHTLALPANSAVANDGAGVITITPDAGAVDFISFFYDGTTFWWQQAPNFTGA